MTSLQLTENAKRAFDNLALSYSNDGEIKEAIKLATTFLETKADTSDFKLVLKLFLEGRINATVEKKNEDGSIITETIAFKRKQWGGSRTGSGRKKGTKTKIVSFRVPEEFVDKLKELVNKAIDSWK